MDDFLSILVVVVFYLIVAANGNKKRKAKNAAKKAPRRRRNAFDDAFPARDAQKTAVQTQPVQAANNAAFHEEACASSRIHLHDVTQNQMHAAGEGEDPCHAGTAPDIHEETEFSYDEDTEQQNALAGDILRGVIMSEILIRPCERNAIRRNGRRTT